MNIRESQPEDCTSIDALYPSAFPEEELRPLVAALLDDSPSVLSLVAMADAALLAHVIFTTCGIADSLAKVALLGPLAVAPDRQGQGIGTALVRAGLEQIAEAGATRVFVLGDPDYYGRFGFAADDDVAPPYPLPREWQGAWQSLALGQSLAVGQEPPELSGTLTVPTPWQQRALWAP